MTRVAVSIVSVFNNPAVRTACLDASIEKLKDTALDVDYLPMDNREQQFATAGAALNEGARQASNDYIVFIQQDIYLHSLVALEEAAGVLAADSGFGMLGAVGIDRNGRIRGLMRDRVVFIGDALTEPTEVDSLDEVIFIVPRKLVLEHPLSEDADLAWHAYAVEYGLRLRAMGLRTGAIDIPLTHNSLSINLARLDDAHAHVAQLHPQFVPVRTTCGTVGAPEEKQGLLHHPKIEPHRWRMTWLRESAVAHEARRALKSPVVLSDPRRIIDELLAGLPYSLPVINVLRQGSAHDPQVWKVELPRRDRRVAFSAAYLNQLGDILANVTSADSLMITNLTPDDLIALEPHLPDGPRRVGYHGGLDCFLLLGPVANAKVAEWETPRTKPVLMARR